VSAVIDRAPAQKQPTATAKPRHPLIPTSLAIPRQLPAPKSDTRETGTPQTGATQTGATQTGATQTGATQTGATQTARPKLARPRLARTPGWHTPRPAALQTGTPQPSTSPAETPQIAIVPPDTTRSLASQNSRPKLATHRSMTPAAAAARGIRVVTTQHSTWGRISFVPARQSSPRGALDSRWYRGASRGRASILTCSPSARLRETGFRLRSGRRRGRSGHDPPHMSLHPGAGHRQWRAALRYSPGSHARTAAGYRSQGPDRPATGNRWQDRNWAADARRNEAGTSVLAKVKNGQRA